MKVLGLDHVSVTCADLDASIAFYHGALGIPIVERGELRGGSAAEIFGVPDLEARFADLALGDGRILELLEIAEHQQAPGNVEPSPRRPGGGHFALRVEDAHSAFAHLRAAGHPTASATAVTIDEPGAWHRVRAFYARDPDGVTVEILERPTPTTATDRDTAARGNDAGSEIEVSR